MDRKCDPDVSPDCPGHPGWAKFGDCLSQVAYEWPDDTAGDVDGFGMWVGLMLQEAAETVDALDGSPVTIPAGTYAVVTESESGAIGFTVYGTAQEAQDAFDGWVRAYDFFLAGQETAEAGIVSSAGRIGS